MRRGLLGLGLSRLRLEQRRLLVVRFWDEATGETIYLCRARAHGLLIRPTRSFSPPLMSDSARLSLCLLPASPVLTFEFWPMHCSFIFLFLCLFPFVLFLLFRLYFFFSLLYYIFLLYLSIFTLIPFYFHIIFIYLYFLIFYLVYQYIFTHIFLSQNQLGHAAYIPRPCVIISALRLLLLRQ